MMSSDWQPGDLALCARAAGTPLKRGRLYTVAEVWIGGTVSHGFSHNWEGVGLRFGFERSSVNWCASRFRKINPLTDEEREQFTADLNEPVKERVP